MIPRAVEEVFKVAEDLQCKGWEYRMEGQFLEIVRFNILSKLTPYSLAFSVQRDDQRLAW